MGDKIFVVVNGELAVQKPMDEETEQVGPTVGLLSRFWRKGFGGAWWSRKGLAVQKPAEQMCRSPLSRWGLGLERRAPPSP